jgi:putative membrane protein
MFHVLWRWIVLCIAVFVAAHLSFLGISYDRWQDVVVAALVLSMVNTFVRPILMIFTLPLIFFSLGLFVLVINALLLYFVGWAVQGFHVPGFLSAMGGSIIISLVSMLLGANLKRKQPQQGPPPPRSNPPPGQGPIIDI